ncbi:helix-turn-helix transcriptional regulator [Methanobrevibacter sp.]|uniref:helix-turn-helix transcriptional regulator n=1 Tax=Methanobrevibacter sp. TaxID=66852 RepID=UPI003868C0AC
MTSEIRLKLLFSLYESSKSIKELESEFNKKSGNISRGLNELKECKLITRLSNKQFVITSAGFLVAQNLENLLVNFKNIDNNGSFWENHSIKSISNKFLKELSFFNDSIVVKSTITEFARPINIYLKNIKLSNDICMILPVYSKIFMDAIYDSIILHDGHLDLITTKNILDLIVKSDSDRYFKSLVRDKKIDYYIVDDLANIFFTSTNTFTSLYLFFDDVVFDSSEMLFSNDDVVLRDARSFYESYKNHFID